MKVLRVFSFCVLVFGLAAAAAADTGDDLKKLLPNAVSGWERTGTVAFKVGQGFRASGEYRQKGNPHVINIAYQTGAWDAEQKKKQLAAPEEAKKANIDVIEVAGRKWLARTGKGGAGTVQTLSTVLDNGLVITITGFGEDRKAHEGYAKAIDAAALAKLN